MASLYQRGKTFWISYYQDHRLVQKSLRTDNERVARSKLKRIEYELETGEMETETRLAVPLVLESFCQHLRSRRTYKSCKNDLGRLRAFFGPVCDSLTIQVAGGGRNGQKRRHPDKFAGAHLQARYLEEITPEMINRFFGERLRENNWSAKTVNSYRQILHQLFNFAIRHHGFRSRDRRFPNPVEAIDRMREQAPVIRYLTLPQVDEQLKVLQEHRVLRAAVATFIYAGLRREEVTWLMPEDVDLDQRLLRVRAKTADGEFWQPKTRRNRVVPVSEALHKILKEYQPHSGKEWFFASPEGVRWNVDNLSQDLRAINRKHKLDWSCLDFRHTFGSQLAQKGESLFKIATLMGNSPEICRRHYAALVPEEMHDTVEFRNGANSPNAATDDNGELQVLLARVAELLDRQQNGNGTTQENAT